MGAALQVLTGRVTNPGVTLTALTADTGDSFTVRSYPFGSKAQIVQAWALGATAGVIRVRSPRLHDAANGIRLRTTAATPAPLLPDGLEQQLQPQDVLTFEQSGGGAEVDMASLLVYYEDLPGIAAQLASWDQLKGQIVNLVGVEVNLTTGATAGQYGGSQALNANFDILKRNIKYAILGYDCDVTTGTVGITGPDIGNLRVAGPGLARSEVTMGWFKDLAIETGQPMIPVINSANVANTIVDVADTATAAARNITFVMAELAQGA